MVNNHRDNKTNIQGKKKKISSKEGQNTKQRQPKKLPTIKPFNIVKRKKLQLKYRERRPGGFGI